MPSFKLLSFITFVIMQQNPIATVHAFAAWLCEGSHCWTDLMEGEVIMNHPAKLQSPSASDDGIRIRLLDYENSDMPYATSTYLANDRVWVRADFNSDSDYQYVLEVSEGGTFENGGCDGRRVSGYGNKQESFALTFSGEHETVEIWGGWARGHEAVNITPKLVLKRYDDNMEQQSMQEQISGGDVNEKNDAADIDDHDDDISLALMSEEEVLEKEEALLDKEIDISLKIERLEQEREKKMDGDLKYIVDKVDVMENNLLKDADVVLEAKEEVELVNEIRDETREVASTVADTRTRQKIKRKDLPISSKDEMKFSIMSSTLDEKESSFSMELYPYACGLAIFTIIWGIALSKGDSVRHHRW
eukprot:CAMPEP_0116067542 /NCGR_PEP_ID=MMETSP0322-20121206/11101_1 /TAXON_ID=163516 /ORGANISM="Leptocylindrus danicus var. apora, Strain B651" /LENGTH=360 /DNA_ID=CAMNT_0003554429 /DNA_START=61 /DNA_END=1140 /DNA_ORIENTATION=+